MDFVAEYNALGERGLSETALAEARKKLLGDYINNPYEGLFAQLQEHHPILSFPGIGIVTKYEDVAEVMKLDHIFSVREYTPKMERVGGPFVLGMDDSEAYRHDESVLEGVIERTDVDIIRQIAVEVVQEQLAEVRGVGTVELVSQLTHVVPTKVVGRYFGTPGPDDATLQRWARTIFDDIFANLLNRDEGREKALQSGREIRPYLDNLIAERKAAIKAGQDNSDDLLGRLIRRQLAHPPQPGLSVQAKLAPSQSLADQIFGVLETIVMGAIKLGGWAVQAVQQLMAKPQPVPLPLPTPPDPNASFDDIAIRNNLIGIIAGAIDTVSKAATNVINELATRPDQLAGACQAAQAGDDKLLDQYIKEALRFRPQNVFLVRYCEQPYVVAKGTKRASLFFPGSRVAVANSAAMFDPDILHDPHEFRLDRPDGHYLHFGYGLHSCYGRYMATTMLREIVRGVVQLPNLHLAPPPDGTIQMEGIYPTRLVLNFEQG